MITVYYHCTKCGLQETAVLVRARASADVSQFKWMQDDVMPIVKADHARQRPHCQHTMASMRFPFDAEAAFLGQQTSGQVSGDVSHQDACPRRRSAKGVCRCDPRELPRHLRGRR